MRLAVQLFTLRDDLARDFEGTLAAVADAGVGAVELAGLHERSAEAFGEALARHRLTALSAHAMPALDGSNLDGVIADAKTLGYSRIVWPWLEEASRRDAGAFAEALRPLGDRLAAHGLRLGYHNHDFEFLGGFLGDLFDAAPWLEAQLDVYWAAYAGQDPVLWIKSLAPRLTSVHLKDGVLGGAPKFVPAGEGDLDWDPILAACHESGVQAGIIELDTCDGSPVEAVARSAQFFRARGLN